MAQAGMDIQTNILWHLFFSLVEVKWKVKNRFGKKHHHQADFQMLT